MKHLLAIYVEHLDEPSDKFFYRCRNILRLRPGQQIIMFDSTHRALATIVAYHKDSIDVSLEDRVPLKLFKPEIHWLLPILKREAFEQALYSLCMMGVTSIYPVRAEKMARSWGSEKEYARAKSVMIAAAAQSKQYVLPEIHPVSELLEWQGEGVKIFFDPEGRSVREVLVVSVPRMILP